MVAISVGGPSKVGFCFYAGTATREIEGFTATFQCEDSRFVPIAPTRDVEWNEPLRNDSDASNSAPTESATEAQLAATVGKNLRLYRIRRGLTLERLSKASGVSRAMLSQVELGRSTPTIKVVWKVARTLGLPFSALMSDNEVPGCYVLRQKDSKVLASQDGKCRSRALFPFTGPRRFEFYEIHLLEGATEQVHAHDSGAIQNLVVTQGELELIVERRSERLSRGDSIVLGADMPHSYVNCGTGDLIMYLVIFYGERSL